MHSYSPAAYVGIFTILADRARKVGYCLAMHGTLAKDLDAVAVPWTEYAIEPEALVRELASAINLDSLAIHGPAKKPHGRRAWTLALSGGARVDLSVMPRKFNAKEKG